MRYLRLIFVSTIIVIGSQATKVLAQIKAIDIIGAWTTGKDTVTTPIFSDQHFASASYCVGNKQFFSTAGGKWMIEENELLLTFEFHSIPALVGSTIKEAIKLSDKNVMVTTTRNYVWINTKWKKIDNGTPGQLSGAWLITGKMDDDQMRVMTPGVRRTMKILSGTRFQWIAYNVDTKQFSGTGGGTYTTENGKYTENILFFSRDNNRVGTTLQFDFSIEDGNWRHKGVSSKGDPIHEVWTKREKIGL